MLLRRAVFLVTPLIVLWLPVSTRARNDVATYPSQVTCAERIHIRGISLTGRRLNKFLYRGNQPKPKGIDELKELGIDTIVDLRGERHGLMMHERKHAESLGMRFVNIPGNGWSPPSDEQVAQFFGLIRDRPRRHIFIHCWLGGDRVGVFLATYRIAFEGWTPDQALHEMHMFHFHGFWHPAMTAYIKGFPEHLATSQELAQFRRESR